MKAYKEDTTELCKTGFHACKEPIDVFGYYPPADSRYCEINPWDSEGSCSSTMINTSSRSTATNTDRRIIVYNKED